MEDNVIDLEKRIKDTLKTKVSDLEWEHFSLLFKESTENLLIYLKDMAMSIAGIVDKVTQEEAKELTVSVNVLNGDIRTIHKEMVEIYETHKDKKGAIESNEDIEQALVLSKRYDEVTEKTKRIVIDHLSSISLTMERVKAREEGKKQEQQK